MSAAQYNLLCEQGSNFSQAIQWKTGTPAAAVNLSGYTARSHWRTSVSASNPSMVLTTENGRIALTANTGTITLSINATDTAALAAGRYVYDLELVSGGGQVTRLMEGVVTVSAEVTR